MKFTSRTSGVAALYGSVTPDVADEFAKILIACIAILHNSGKSSTFRKMPQH
ncbi:hypothetical protein [Paenibacillus sp. PCH8]|uniref:hypothetical protein n=1 Tax=Paenibacillus sp. PCH8 TaxID=2066524 RepID=UPI0015E3104C|nr:hypothetical protein [Paenibacillus sp. PCH8]